MFSFIFGGGGIGSLLFVCLYSLIIWISACVDLKFHKKIIFVVSIILSICPLIFLKYFSFVIENVNKSFGLNDIFSKVMMPIGVSFFTFEAVSFLSDVHKRKIDECPNLIFVFLYLTFFPTVTSGPIIRFDEFKKGLHSSKVTIEDASAIERIIIGLFKKVFIADKISILSNYYFDGVAAGNKFSCLGLWIGSIAYTLQLYFDFSGYSDMAIGIGKLFGFDIRENFNRPYQAVSISDFWKRWHISLTDWFRDYIYIPLGGNRCSTMRHIANLFVVWLVTGIWHGEDGTFILWGMAYFILLLIEKYALPKNVKVPKLVGHIYTLFFINLLWIPFRSIHLSAAFEYMKGMFGAGLGAIEEKAVKFIPLAALAIVMCLPLEEVFNKRTDKKWFKMVKGIMMIVLMVLAFCAAVNSSYAPYIYGNF